MKIFLWTDGIDKLDYNSFTTSSAKYEYNIAFGLSKIVDTILLTTKLDFGVCERRDKLLLYGISKNYKKNFSKILKMFDENSWLIFWGYNLEKVLFLNKLHKNSNINIVPFEYDTHIAYIKSLPLLKKVYCNIFCNIGKNFIRKFNNFILFQEKAKSYFKIEKKRCLVTKPGVDKIDIDFNNKHDRNIFFAGTFSYLNCTKLLLDSFIDIKDSKLLLAGNGPQINIVKEYGEKYDNIQYLGVLNQDEIVNTYRVSNMLINLRLIDKNMDVAFPSKFFEMCVTGIPIISNKIIDDQFINNNIYCIDELTEENIINAINFVRLHYDEYIEKAKKLKDYILNFYNYDVLAKQIYDFLNIKVNNE